MHKTGCIKEEGMLMSGTSIKYSLNAGFTLMLHKEEEREKRHLKCGSIPILLYSYTPILLYCDKKMMKEEKRRIMGQQNMEQF